MSKRLRVYSVVYHYYHRDWLDWVSMKSVHSNHFISRSSYVNLILALLKERESLTNQINEMYDKEWQHFL